MEKGGATRDCKEGLYNCLIITDDSLQPLTELKWMSQNDAFNLKLHSSVSYLGL